MSKINELIQTLCPDGVEYKKLGEVGCVRMCKRIMKDQTSSTGDVPFYKIGTFGGTANAYITQELFDEYSSRYNYPKKGNILISAAGTIGRTVVFDGKPSYFQDSNIVWLEHDGTQVTDEYLKYIYSTSPWYVADGGTISRLYNNNILNAVIPVPPLPVQEEIVRILDEYTDLEAELEAKLSEEIELKQKQYEFYMEMLLTFNDDVKQKPLSAVAQFFNGDRGKNYPNANDIVEVGVPFVNAGDVDGVVDTVNCKKITREKYDSLGGAKLKQYDILYCLRGSTGKNGIYQDDKGTVASSLVAIRVSGDKANYKYVYYLLNSRMERVQRFRADTGAAQPNLSAQNVKGYMFPFPSLTEQERIVKTLDKYDTYTRDMISTLNTELESRKKQYAYYRDQLLTFKRKEV